MNRSSVIGRLTLTGLATLAAATVPIGTASATAHLSCGAVVTTDVRLTADITDCPASGLIVGADGITIDLAGHTISGHGVGAGIDNSAGHDRLTLRNGTLTGFVFGVHLFDTTDTQLRRLHATGNSIGFVIEQSSNVTLERSAATTNEAVGVEMTFGDGNTTSRVRASSNGIGGIVDRFSNGSTHDRNDLIANTGPGLLLERVTDSTVSRNRSTANNGDGIALTSTETVTVTANVAIANAGFGIVAPGRHG
jgi:hypothetical protein